MELINATRMAAGYTVGVDRSGRESLIVVIKGTFRMPAPPDISLRLHEEEQAPLVMSDVFFGEPGLSAPRYEVDFALRKPRCDVLLNGTAHVPSGRLADRIVVGMRVGGRAKSFTVVGDRFWYWAGGPRATPPEPFESMPVVYDRAFGGVDHRPENPAEHAAFLANPSGRGFHKHVKPEWLQSSLLPNTEETHNPVTTPDGIYQPMSFGALGRHWHPRIQYAGTYDQRWLENVFPFLPADFDEQYFQAAPLDQQFSLPLGEQPVTLINLTRDGRRDFLLPHFEAPVHVFPKSGGREDLTAHSDTVIIEPDAERVTMTWRVSRPLKRNIFEITQVLVGRKGRDWWQQREELRFPLPVVVERVAKAKPEPVQESTA